MGASSCFFFPSCEVLAPKGHPYLRRVVEGGNPLGNTAFDAWPKTRADRQAGNRDAMDLQSVRGTR